MGMRLRKRRRLCNIQRNYSLPLLPIFYFSSSQGRVRRSHQMRDCGALGPAGTCPCEQSASARPAHSLGLISHHLINALQARRIEEATRSFDEINERTHSPTEGNA